MWCHEKAGEDYSILESPGKSINGVTTEPGSEREIGNKTEKGGKVDWDGE